jgi:hypothetical protein
MAAVWERSQHSGTSLLMLLAIADFADDDGRAYPSIPTLARKCRMKERNAQYILAELVESGELSAQRGKGPRGSNVYRIKLASLGVQQSAPLQYVAPLQQSAPNPCNGVRITPATECTQTTIESSKNHQHDFDRFWKAYPKKTAKGDALKAWKKLKVDSSLLDLILKAIDQQKTSEAWTKDKGQFIPYPATWLNGQRWEDEVCRGAAASGQSLIGQIQGLVL